MKALKLFELATGLERKRLKYHKWIVKCLAFSPDGCFLATGSVDQTVCISDAYTGKQLHSLDGHEHHVQSVAFSSDAKLLAAGSSDNSIRLWDLASSGRKLRKLRDHESDIHCIAFSPDGRFLATGAYDKTVRLWDAASGAPIRMWSEDQAHVNGVSFSADSRLPLSRDGFSVVRLWDTERDTSLATIDPPNTPVGAQVLSPDNENIVCGLSASGLKVSKVGRLEVELFGQELFSVETLAFSSDGRYLACNSDNTVRVWSFVERVERFHLDGRTRRVKSVGFLEEGERLISISEDGTARVWDLEQQRCYAAEGIPFPSRCILPP